jgi:hypothetical protein
MRQILNGALDVQDRKNGEADKPVGRDAAVFHQPVVVRMSYRPEKRFVFQAQAVNMA